MICPNCNTEINDGFAFCPNCGCSLAQHEAPAAEPVEEPAEELAEEPVAEPAAEDIPEAPETPETYVLPGIPEEPAKKSKTGLIIGIAVAVVAVLAIVGIKVFGSNPLALVREAAKNTADARTAKIKEAGNSATLAINYDMSSLAADLAGFDIPASADIVLAADGENKAVSLKVNANVMNTPFADASAWLTSKDIIVGSDVLLDGSYGMSFADMEKNLPGSVLNPDKGYMTQTAYDSLMNTAKNNGDMEGLVKDLTAVVKNTTDVISKSVEKNSTAEKTKADVEFGSETLNLTVVTVDINAKQFAEIVSDTVEYMKNDAEFKKNLDNIADSYAELIEDITGEPVATTIEEFYEDLEDFDKEQFLKEHEADEAILALKFTINNSKELIGFNGSFIPEDITVDFQCGPDAAKPVYIYTSVTIDGDSGSVRYKVTENSDSLYHGDLSVKISGATPFGASVNWDKTNGEFTLKCFGVTVKADVKKQDGGVTVVPKSVSGLGLDEYSEYLNKATITLSRKADIPAAPKYKDILTMSEEELEEVGNELNDIPSNLAYALYGLFF